MITQEELLVDAALDIGETLLLSGDEVGRVENIITRILEAYGMTGVGVFTITSLIEVNARTPGGDEILKARRIVRGFATDLDVVERVNILVRDICMRRPSPEVITRSIEDIRQPRREPAWIGYVGAMLAAASFAIFFGGTAADIPATIILACFINLMDRKGIYKSENKLLFYLLCSILTGFMGCVLVNMEHSR